MIDEWKLVLYVHTFHFIKNEMALGKVLKESHQMSEIIKLRLQTMQLCVKKNLDKLEIFSNQFSYQRKLFLSLRKT